MTNEFAVRTGREQLKTQLAELEKDGGLPEGTGL